MSENKLNEIPEVMMAVQLTGNGGPEKLSILHDVPVPEIGEDEVLLRVKTCGMNNTDMGPGGQGEGGAQWAWTCRIPTGVPDARGDWDLQGLR